MKVAKLLTLLAGLALVSAFGGSSTAEAGYYGGWNYYGARSYYYSSYYYTPSYYHYCVYYPSYPRYVYYYNPYSHSYWGRFDLQGKPGQQYSLLAPKDRKGSLAEIPESAFPAPGPMPSIPGVKNGTPIETPPAPPAA